MTNSPEKKRGRRKQDKTERIQKTNYRTHGREQRKDDTEHVIQATGHRIQHRTQTDNFGHRRVDTENRTQDT